MVKNNIPFADSVIKGLGVEHTLGDVIRIDITGQTTARTIIKAVPVIEEHAWETGYSGLMFAGKMNAEQKTAFLRCGFVEDKVPGDEWNTYLRKNLNEEN